MEIIQPSGYLSLRNAHDILTERMYKGISPSEVAFLKKLSDVTAGAIRKFAIVPNDHFSQIAKISVLKFHAQLLVEIARGPKQLFLRKVRF